MIVKQIQCRRYGMKHNLEVLVYWENGSIFNAQWVPQNKLKSGGSKELGEYMNRQFFFSPVWKYILNVSEVWIHSILYCRSKSTINASLQFFSPNTQLLVQAIVRICVVFARPVLPKYSLYEFLNCRTIRSSAINAIVSFTSPVWKHLLHRMYGFTRFQSIGRLDLWCVQTADLWSG